MSTAGYGEERIWRPARPRLSVVKLLVTWLIATVSLLIGCAIVPGAHVNGFGGALAAAVVIGILNALLPPIIAALRLPLTLLVGFFLILILDALILLAASDITGGKLKIDSFGAALLVAIIASAAGVALGVLFGTEDDDTYSLQVIRRIANRDKDRVQTDSPGILFLEIDGLALPVLQRAMRDGSAPTMARWLTEGTHRLAEWETDLSSQTGASQSGILLGSNEDIPAFRWVEKERDMLVACSGPADCAEIERRHATGRGLLIDGGSSRGNLLSGEADHVILTVSRMDAEKKSNPGYRTFLANGTNVTRVLSLAFWEVILEWTAALRAIRRDIEPRGHRGGKYPFLRAGICIVVRELIVFGVLTDMFKGRPAIYATFSSYDEVAHHSGLERADTMEALRKLDGQFARIDRARQFAPRPYEIVILSDHGQTQGATFKQRNGYGLDELVRRSIDRGRVADLAGGDENDQATAHAVSEATGVKAKPKKNDVSGEDVVVLGSGNLGLVYLMEEKHRLTLGEIESSHPRLIPALRQHPHIGWILVNTSDHGPVALGADGANYLAEDRVEGEDPLAGFAPRAGRHLLRASGFEHAPDIYVGSFYDPAMDEGCAFEELISFHGGIGGPQTRPFILHPINLTLPDEPIVGAAAVHDVLAGWRRVLNGSSA
jgi:uncharacterized membrane protein YvlD (DUF360 family)